MSIGKSNHRVDVPKSLQRKLLEFRRQVRSTKTIEALALVVGVGLLSFLTVYGVDRLGGAPSSLRWLLFFASLAVWATLIYAVDRWVWRTRHLEQVARLLRRREPGIGDELLSVLELSRNDIEQSRSRALCEAAIRQVAERAEERDFRNATPRHFLRPLAITAGIALVVAVSLGAFYPKAFRNALARFALPWSDIERFTFAAVEPLPMQNVVPHGEPNILNVDLKSDSQWSPETATAALGPSTRLSAERTERSYRFELPPQVASVPMRLDVGDYHQTVEIVPMVRPELTGVTAGVELPAYLERKDTMEIDVRSGVLMAVQGSMVRLNASASRELESAWVDDQPGAILPTLGRASFVSNAIPVGEDNFVVPLRWRDAHGLTGKTPFLLDVRPVPDEPPSAAAQGLPEQMVVLESEQINFQILAADDFGVKRVGISWRGLDDPLVARPAEGARVLASGGPDQTSVQSSATFCAATLGIPAQRLELTVWAEDYMPGRPREVSLPCILYVLTAEEHAIWITNQINKWQGAALDVRDVEMQLHETNKRLRDDAGREMGSSDFVNTLRRQASLEEANGRKLNSLTHSGTDLLRQAARNPSIAAESVNQLAQMLDVLGDISENRMPSVADLLNGAATNAAAQNSDATAEGQPADSKSKDSRQVGQIRANPQGGSDAQQGATENEGDDDKSNVSSIVDMESSMQPIDQTNEQQEDHDADEKKSGQSNGRLGMAQTTLIGPPKNKEEANKKNMDKTNESLEQAVSEQSDLLAEFDKVADELNAVLANLEGATLVKRLKAASREQSQVAEKIASKLETVFGHRNETSEQDRAVLSTLTQAQYESSQSIAYIMDDMQAYYDRRKYNDIKQVLEDMKGSDVLASIKKMGDDLPTEHGVSIAQAEYWADTLDRWAEDLVPSGDSSAEEQDQQSDEPTESLPPAIVLEMLRILESEVNLREETRVVQQASQAVEAEVHDQEAKQLSLTQGDLRKRVDDLNRKIGSLPNAQKQFRQETNILAAVSTAMEEARIMLELGNTGPQSIAAETEAIELLLQSQRINPEGGSGGGGSSPGGGGTGTTQESALALLGAGLNQNEHREHRDVGQAVGKSSERVLPEEFRAGLDTYFQMIEKK